MRDVCKNLYTYAPQQIHVRSFVMMLISLKGLAKLLIGEKITNQLIDVITNNNDFKVAAILKYGMLMMIS